MRRRGLSPHAEKRVRYSFALAHLLHIRPWEIDLLTYEQFENACRAVDEYERQMKQGKE